MLNSKKGVALPINVVIIGILGLLVLVIISVSTGSQLLQGNEALDDFSSCSTYGGSCVTSCTNGELIVGNHCEKGLICCKTTSEQASTSEESNENERSSCTYNRDCIRGVCTDGRCVYNGLEENPE